MEVILIFFCIAVFVTEVHGTLHNAPLQRVLNELGPEEPTYVELVGPPIEYGESISNVGPELPGAGIKIAHTCTKVISLQDEYDYFVLLDKNRWLKMTDHLTAVRLWTGSDIDTRQSSVHFPFLRFGLGGVVEGSKEQDVTLPIRKRKRVLWRSSSKKRAKHLAKKIESAVFDEERQEQKNQQIFHMPWEYKESELKLQLLLCNTFETSVPAENEPRIASPRTDVRTELHGEVLLKMILLYKNASQFVEQWSNHYSAYKVTYNTVPATYLVNNYSLPLHRPRQHRTTFGILPFPAYVKDLINGVKNFVKRFVKCYIKRSPFITIPYSAYEPPNSAQIPVLPKDENRIEAIVFLLAVVQTNATWSRLDLEDLRAAGALPDATNIGPLFEPFFDLFLPTQTSTY